MKKLMVAAVAMAMAVAANAATTAWGLYYAEEDFAGSGTPQQFIGGTAFLYTYTGDVAPFFDTEKGVWNLDNARFVGKGDGNDYGQWGKMDISSASKLDDFSIAADQKYAIILTSEKATDLASFVGDDRFAATVTGVTFESQGFEEVGGAAFTYIDASYTDMVYANGWVNVKSAAPIPEPTSGLLLLLGVAGMALRRRRA